MYVIAKHASSTACQNSSDCIVSIRARKMRRVHIRGRSAAAFIGTELPAAKQPRLHVLSLPKLPHMMHGMPTFDKQMGRLVLQLVFADVQASGIQACLNVLH